MLPGNAVAVSPGKPFRGLQIFGDAFLQKFQCAEMKSEILESMTLIDTPGLDAKPTDAAPHLHTTLLLMPACRLDQHIHSLQRRNFLKAVCARLRCALR